MSDFCVKHTKSNEKQTIPCAKIMFINKVTSNRIRRRNCSKLKTERCVEITPACILHCAKWEVSGENLFNGTLEGLLVHYHRFPPF